MEARGDKSIIQYGFRLCGYIACTPAIYANVSMRAPTTVGMHRYVLSHKCHINIYTFIYKSFIDKHKFKSHLHLPLYLIGSKET